MKKKILTVLLVLSLGLFAANLLFVSAEDSNSQTDYSGVKQLFTEYYGSGTYIKDTKIYLKEETKDEVSEYFHSEIPSLERTTYYSGSELLMSNGNGYSGYGTTNVDGTDYVTSFKVSKDLVRGTESNTGILGGMEGYYCTLHDFVEGTHSSSHVFNESKTIDLSDGWTYSNGVYTSTSEDVLDGFRLFTAPLWLGKNVDNSNYIIFTKATVEEVNDKLLLNLYVSSGDWGKIDTKEDYVDGKSYLFSQAVISKPLVENQVTVNGKTFDVSSCLNYVLPGEENQLGYYNYNLVTEEVVNLSNANLSMTDSTHKVLYLNEALSGTYSVEVTIDMSSLDNEKNSTYARQGIVLSNGSVELAIFPARWTSGNATNPTLEPGTGYWWIKSNSTAGELVSDAGLYAGVGKCVSPKFASEFTLKVERIGNSHINLYVDGELITILKADGLYDASTGNKSSKTAFNNDLAALLSSDEMLIGFNHFNSLNFPNIVYKNIEVVKYDEIFKTGMNVNGQTWNQTTTLPSSSYDVINGKVTFNSTNNANGGTSDVAFRQNGVLYLNDVQTGSFELTYKVNVSQAADGTAQRVGFAITDGTNTIRVLQFWGGVQIIANNNNSSLDRSQSGLSWALGTKHNSSNAAAFDECMMKVLFDKENNQIVVSYATITNDVVGDYVEIVRLTTNGTFKADGTEIMTNDYDIFQKRVASFMNANEVAIGFCSYSQTPNAVLSDIKIIQK